MRNKLLRFVLPVAAFLSCGGAILAEDFTYEITVNTTSVNGSYGYIELQLQPGTLTPAPITASIGGWQGASLNPSDPTYPPAGNFSGSLDANNLVLQNYSGSAGSPVFGPADYVEGINFTSNQISFLLTINGIGASTPAGTTSGTQFALDFFNAAGDYLLTDDPTAANPITPANPDPDYYAGVVDVDTEGNITTNGSGGGANDVTFTPAVGAAPEPGSAIPLFALSIALIFFARIRRPHRACFFSERVLPPVSSPPCRPVSDPKTFSIRLPAAWRTSSSPAQSWVAPRHSPAFHRRVQ